MSGRLRMRLFALITFVNVVLGVSLGGLLYTIWPDHYFTWFPSIPLFYWLTAMGMVAFLDSVKRHKRDMSITVFMVVRMCRFVLACAFLWMYAAWVGEKLKAFGFSRVHKSYLVNMAKVEGIQGKELTVAGHAIPISRNYRDSFMQDYMKFYRGE